MPASSPDSTWNGSGSPSPHVLLFLFSSSGCGMLLYPEVFVLPIEECWPTSTPSCSHSAQVRGASLQHEPGDRVAPTPSIRQRFALGLSTSECKEHPPATPGTCCSTSSDSSCKPQAAVLLPNRCQRDALLIPGAGGIGICALRAAVT